MSRRDAYLADLARTVAKGRARSQFDGAVAQAWDRLVDELRSRESAEKWIARVAAEVRS